VSRQRRSVRGLRPRRRGERDGEEDDQEPHDGRRRESSARRVLAAQGAPFP
jgi:hypothetical protein